MRDLRACEWLRLFDANTIIVADNVIEPGAPEYREYVISQPGVSGGGVRDLLMPGGFEARRANRLYFKHGSRQLIYTSGTST